jgi:Na+/melibiose symporter-like transporter
VLAENFYPQRRAQLNHQAIEALGESEVLFCSFFYASLVFSVLCAVMLTFVWCFTWERPREAWSGRSQVKHQTKVSITAHRTENTRLA